jgi:hypothetical protein
MKSNPVIGLAGAVLVGLAGMAIAGCSSTQTHTYAQNVAVRNAGTDATRVELIPWAPPKLYERVGEVVMETSPKASRLEVESKLQQAAADLGGHAMYIVSDPGHHFPTVEVDPAPGEPAPNYPADAIVAVVIRYK